MFAWAYGLCKWNGIHCLVLPLNKHWFPTVLIKTIRWVFSMVGFQHALESFPPLSPDGANPFFQRSPRVRPLTFPFMYLLHRPTVLALWSIIVTKKFSLHFTFIHIHIHPDKGLLKLIQTTNSYAHNFLSN